VSKSTARGTSLKFAQAGKREIKKDLGFTAMAIRSAYVASCAIGANYT